MTIKHAITLHLALNGNVEMSLRGVKRRGNLIEIPHRSFAFAQGMVRNYTSCQFASRSLYLALRFPQYGPFGFAQDRLRECVRNDSNYWELAINTFQNY